MDFNFIPSLDFLTRKSYDVLEVSHQVDLKVIDSNLGFSMASLSKFFSSLSIFLT